jgi:DNA invertase Pin-like site-specific DNA recombinase
MRINIEIGIKRKSGRGANTAYQNELLEKCGANEIITVKESAHDEYRPIFCNAIHNLPNNTNVGFTDISRITRQGYDDLLTICHLLWNKNTRIFVVQGETINNYEITKENISSLKYEANEAVKDTYLRSQQTKKGIVSMKKKHQRNQSKPNTGLPIKKDIEEKIYSLNRQGLSQRKIGAELGICYQTVNKYLKKKREENNNA